MKYVELRKLMAGSGVGQVQLAEIAGISLVSVNHKLQGRRDWKLSECVAIAEHFNHTVDFIFR